MGATHLSLHDTVPGYALRQEAVVIEFEGLAVGRGERPELVRLRVKLGLNPIPRESDGLQPSDLVVIGRYALSPRVFHKLEVTPAGAGGEIQLTDAIRLLLREEPVYALEFAGVRYDTGDPVGLLTTSLAYALKRPDLAPGVKAFLRTLRLD